MRKHGFTLRGLLAFIAIISLVALIVPIAARAGDVVTRVYHTWTSASGTNITANSWDHWTVDKVEFYALNPTNTVMTIAVKYAVGSYTQTVGAVTGDTSGVASYTTDFPVAPGDVVTYTPGAVSTGKVVTTYNKQNP
jgi:hypothetical protein